MELLRDMSRSVILVAAAGLATWSIGCAERPAPSSSGGGGPESGSTIQAGADVDNGQNGTDTAADATAQENPPLRAPGPAESSPPSDEKDNTPRDEKDNTPL